MAINRDVFMAELVKRGIVKDTDDDGEPSLSEQLDGLGVVKAVANPVTGGIELIGPGGEVIPTGGDAQYTDPAKYYFATNRAKTPGSVMSVTASNKMLVRLYLGTAPFASHSYRLAFPGHSNLTNGGWPTEFNLTTDITIDGVAIGYGLTTDPTAATYIAGTVAGAAGAVITTANAVGILTDDIISATAPIPAGYHRWAQIAISTAASVSIPSAYTFTPSTVPAIEGTVRSATTYSATSNAAITPGTIPSPAYGPSFVVCKGHAGKAAFLIWGDSISAGLNEQPDTYTNGISGFISRGLENASSKMFGANFGVPGAGPHQWTYSGRVGCAGNKIDLIKLVPNLPFTHIISEHGTNSVNGIANGTVSGTTSGGTLDTITGQPWNTPAGFIAGMKAYSDLLRTEFGAAIPIHQTTVICKGSTTTGWSTAAGTTPNGATLAQGFGFNAQLQTDLVGGKFVSYIDTASIAGDTSDKSKWAVHPFQTTLAADYVSLATTCSLVSVTGLSVGDGLIIDPLGLVSQSNPGNGIGSFVIGITGTGPYTVTLSSPRAYTVNPTAGTQVNGEYTRDGTHPNASMHKLMAVAVTKWAEKI